MPLRIIVSKPKNGQTTVEFDDSRGQTHYRARSGPIPTSEVGSYVLARHGEFQQIKDDIKAARRKKTP